MRKQATAVGVAIAVAIVPLLAGCGSGGDSSGNEGTVITVSANLIEKPALDAVISKFQSAHPDISVEPAYATQVERAPLLSTQLQAGTGPDVIGLLGGNAAPPSVFQFAKSGNLTDLSSAPWASEIPEFVKPVVTDGGVVYGLPALTYTVALMYNTQLFDSLGLEVPTTFDELLTLCGAIRDKDPGVTPIAWPGVNPAYVTDVMQMAASSDVYAQNPDWDKQRASGDVKFQTTPGWRTAVERVVRMKDANCLGPSTVSDTFQQSVAQMAGEKAAMLMGGDILLPAMRAANNKISFGMFPVPGETAAETYVVLDPAENFSVNKASENATAARTFLDFLAEPEQATLLATTVGSVSPQDYARASEASDPAVAAKALGEDHKLLAPYASRFVLNRTYTWPSPAISSAMAEAAQGLFTGQTTVDDVLKAADDAWDKASK